MVREDCFMLGYLIWHGEGRPRAVLERRLIGGAWFLVLEAWGSQRRLSRRVKRGLQAMAEHGIRRWIMDPEWPKIWRDGLPQVDEQALRRALLPRLLDWLAEHEGLYLGGAAVELSAPWADQPVWEAARVISRRCRYLRLRMENADALRDDLWRRYGIAAGGEGTAALQVCFGEPVGDAPALLLGPGCGQRQKAEYAVPETVAEKLATYPVTSQLVAALWECGVLKTGEIRPKSLDFHA